MTRLARITLQNKFKLILKFYCPLHVTDTYHGKPAMMSVMIWLNWKQNYTRELRLSGDGTQPIRFQFHIIEKPGRRILSQYCIT